MIIKQTDSDFTIIAGTHPHVSDPGSRSRELDHIQ